MAICFCRAPRLRLRCLLSLVTLCTLLRYASAIAPAGGSSSFSTTASAVEPDSSCSSEEVGKKCGADDNDPHVRRIIHAASVVAAIADGSLAQIPGAGAAIVVPTIQAAMVGLIGRHYGCHMDAGTAMAVVTWLASDHAKKAMFKEIIGYIPLAGNIVKAGLTGFMTEGIGNLASSTLACPKQSEDLLKSVRLKTDQLNRGGGGARDVSANLYHVVSDYLGTGFISARETWERASLLFSTKTQEELLLEVELAMTASALADIIKKYSWNLNVIEPALSALSRRFSEHAGACTVVDFVGEHLWAAATTNAEARSVVTPYLLNCLSHAEPQVRRSLALASVRLLVDTRGGLKGGLSASAVQQMLELVAVTVEEPEAVARTLEPGSGDDLKDIGRAASTVPAVPLSEIRAAISVSMNALQAGQGAACATLRSLLRAEAAAASSVWRGSTAASVRHLELLGRIDVPAGAELCLPSLRADLSGLLSLSTTPPHVQRPYSATEPEARPAGGRSPLEDALSSAISGQHCAIQRLAGTPGYARLKMKGLWAEKPLVLLLTGPSGTGKTLMARTLAEQLLGRPIADLEATGRFRTFHMNGFSMIEDQKSFFGPPKGIVGVGDLPELLKTWPDAVILLDEVEKAHHSFARALLKVFGEHGAVYDPQTGRDISSVKATFILTSNLAKDLISERAQSAMRSSDSDADCELYKELHKDVLDALRSPHIYGRDNFFKESEVRGRLTDVLPFMPFGKKDVENAVRRFLSSEADVFQRSPEFQNAMLSWEPEVVGFLASQYARRPEEGLRGVHTQLQAKVREVLEYAVESGLLQKSGEVILRVRPGLLSSLDLRVLPPRSTAASWLGSGSPSSHQRTEGSTFSSWWPLSFSNPWLQPGAQKPSAPRDTASASIVGQPSSSDAESALDRQWNWEKIHEWDWDLTWQWCQEWMWEYWYVLAIATVLCIAMVGAAPASALVGVSASTAPLYSTAAPAAAPAAAAWSPWAAASVSAVSSAPMLSGLLSAFQLVMPIATTAATVWTGVSIWTNRYAILVVGCAVGMATLLLPSLLKLLCQRLCRRLVLQKDLSEDKRMYRKRHRSRPMSPNTPFIEPLNSELGRSPIPKAAEEARQAEKAERQKRPRLAPRNEESIEKDTVNSDADDEKDKLPSEEICRVSDDGGSHRDEDSVSRALDDTLRSESADREVSSEAN